MIQVAENPSPIPGSIPGPRDTDGRQPCDIDPRGEDPFPGANKFDAFIGSPTDSQDPGNFLTSDTDPTFMLKGTVDMLDPELHGFGYRHIFAKHGWGPTEYAEARDALHLDPLPTQSTALGAINRWVYAGAQIRWGGPGNLLPCIRLVVVERSRLGDQPTEQAGAGIWTSYGVEATQQ